MPPRLGALRLRHHHSMRDDCPPRRPSGRRANPQEIHTMQWNTPTAIDFRFGFEITMYVANR